MQDLGTLPGDDGSAAVAINACGQVVGNSSLSAGGKLHAFIWSKGPGMVGLGVLPGFTDSGAHDINNLGQVVGYCAVAGSEIVVSFGAAPRGYSLWAHCLAALVLLSTYRAFFYLACFWITDYAETLFMKYALVS
jgi:probable HAF family extracellular repeat protein